MIVQHVYDQKSGGCLRRCSLDNCLPKYEQHRFQISTKLRHLLYLLLSLSVACSEEWREFPGFITRKEMNRMSLLSIRKRELYKKAQAATGQICCISMRRNRLKVSVVAKIAYVHYVPGDGGYIATTEWADIPIGAVVSIRPMEP